MLNVLQYWIKFLMATSAILGVVFMVICTVFVVVCVIRGDIKIKTTRANDENAREM